MKFININTICIILLSFSDGLFGQDQGTVLFSYDRAGNMVERKLQVLFGGRPALTKKDPHDSVAILPSLKIFPNPTNQYLNIEGELRENFKEADVILSDLDGKVLKTEKYYGNSKTLNVTDLKSGMYLLEIRYSKKERDTYKIIVTN
jgi:hypothetical protein